MSFRCRDLHPTPIIMGWTRYCEASTKLSNFTCYGLAENTDFQSFLAEADASNLECNSGAYYDETGYPQYMYTVSLPGVTTGFSDTETFDRNKALGGTMNSKFETWTVPPTPSPTTKYPTASPVEPAPSSSIGTTGMGTFAIVAGVIFGLL